MVAIIARHEYFRAGMYALTHSYICHREDFDTWKAALLKYTRLNPSEWKKTLGELRTYTAGHTASKRLKHRPAQHID